ncbi:hypothetical protein [Tenacibaculum sp.]|uniref:hypothetical protein n=1 Tax=Tenacibaculum sp. TaxID=1906242 RepID=UPI003D0FD8B3
MKKVYQTIVAKGNGNCEQAALASIFEMDLNDVINIHDYGEGWYFELTKFYQKNGFEDLTPFNPKGLSKELVQKVLEHDNGVNGYFVATVPSQTFKDVTHAVVIDKSMNIVHDPNPNEKALKLTYNDIIAIDTVKNDWHIDVDGKFIANSYEQV